METVDVASLTRHVLWAVFVLSALFGAIAQRTHFCTMGAVTDIVNFGDWSRMRMWVLAIGTAMIGFNAMVALGWVRAGDSVYATERLIWLSNLAGGVVFGFGMVLASGCGSKSLVRVGGGSLKALVVLLTLSVTSYMTLRGITAVWRVDSVDRVALTLPAGQDLPSLLAHASGAPVPLLAGVLGLAFGGALVAWALARAEGRAPETLLGGVGIGAVIVAVWWVSGRMGFVPEHPDTLEPVYLATNTRSMESLTFVAPIAYALDWLILFSDANKRLTLGVVSVFGVVAGSAAWALASRTFRWEGFGGVEDLANHIVGAALMGIGGVTAYGCTVGQGLTGVSTLALGSFIALGGIVGGAVLGVRYQAWRLERQA
ncbi:MAG: YeeE/YedE family protein [Gammaproteobacteria bacterium]|uniref:YeeE/YedE family protein n=1 Tax=Azohydromonas sp. TaxID=1872666 RepID=UPI002B7A40D2|nr:YeeE/YedE family protein [Azohydromonas sp.]HMM84115.1 YeeE/YedE family protein [Azohydromonas sp.]